MGCSPQRRIAPESRCRGGGGRPGKASMSRSIFRILAVVMIGTAVGLWLATGANRGWTKTSMPVTRTDEVTGITVDDYQKRFVPGVDFLGAAVLASGILAGVSFLFRKPQTQTR